MFPVTSFACDALHVSLCGTIADGQECELVLKYLVTGEMFGRFNLVMHKLTIECNDHLYSGLLSSSLNGQRNDRVLLVSFPFNDHSCDFDMSIMSDKLSKCSNIIN